MTNNVLTLVNKTSLSNLQTATTTVQKISTAPKVSKEQCVLKV